MQFKQSSAALTVVATQRFITKHADRLGPIANSGAKRALDEIGVVLEANAREQAACTAAARRLTRKRREARDALLHAHMAPISYVARIDIADYPEITALHMPRRNIKDQDLIEKAHAMAATAADYSDVLLDSLPDENFVTSLVCAAETLEGALKERGQRIFARQKATAALRSAYSAARLRIRLIDGFVTSAVRHDPALLFEWNNSKRVMMKPGTPRLAIAKPSRGGAEKQP